MKVTPDGNVKVLDFGLAKAWAGDAADGKASSVSASQSPTLAHSGTQAGVILGTAAYMSPEQARGKPVDKRGDVWAFGVLLWEMLTGRVLFAGDTVTDIIAAVVTKDPDLDALPSATPRALRRLLGRCLRKDPRTRLPDIGAARLELEDLLAGKAEEEAPGAADGQGPATARARGLVRQRALWAAVALVSTGLAAYLAFLHLTEVREPRPAIRFAVDTPEELTFDLWWDTPAVSPDGRQVVFGGRSSDGTSRLWIRALASMETRALPGTEAAFGAPFWSPDGGAIAFSAGGELKRLSLAGGTVQRVCALPADSFLGGTWNSGGTIVFASGGPAASLYSVAAAGGEAKPLTTHDASREESGHFWPWFLPDGHRFLFAVGSAREDNVGLYVASLDAPEQRVRLQPGSVRAIYASGHLLFVRDETLLAQPFDARSLALSGEPVPVAANVARFGGVSWGSFSASPGDVLAYRSGGAGQVQLAWVDRKGARLETVGEPRSYGQIALSPDERRIAAEIRGREGTDIWAIDVARGVPSRVTSEQGSEFDPVWSPDGQTLAYGSAGEDGYGLFFKGLSGEAAVPIPGVGGASAESRPIPESWSSDGSTLIYKTFNGTTVWALPLVGGGDPRPVLEVGFRVDETQISAAGRWLAYVSEESGDWEVYVAPFGRPGERARVSVGGGGQPKCRSDGKELFYVAADDRLMAVDVREGKAGPDVSLPTGLFGLEVVTSQVSDDYGVSADGQRFIVKVRPDDAPMARIHVITNWTSLLERR